MFEKRLNVNYVWKAAQPNYVWKEAQPNYVWKEAQTNYVCKEAVLYDMMLPRDLIQQYLFSY
jgi:hypothetical protein